MKTSVSVVLWLVTTTMIAIAPLGVDGDAIADPNPKPLPPFELSPAVPTPDPSLIVFTMAGDTSQSCEEVCEESEYLCYPHENENLLENREDCVAAIREYYNLQPGDEAQSTYTPSTFVQGCVALLVDGKVAVYWNNPNIQWQRSCLHPKSTSNDPNARRMCKCYRSKTQYHFIHQTRFKSWYATKTCYEVCEGKTCDNEMTRDINTRKTACQSIAQAMFDSDSERIETWTQEDGVATLADGCNWDASMPSDPSVQFVTPAYGAETGCDAKPATERTAVQRICNCFTKF